ncbi:MAG: 50S ribosome-binding GTPase [Phycisphaerales bacterium]|nr:50S ribosome-binding GTPase [Phycisphaerales bacterium]
MNPTDGAVIVATGTPPGRGSRALVRCSGGEILSNLDGLLSGEAMEAGRDRTRGVFPGNIRIPKWPDGRTGGEVLVPCLAAIFPGPATFTGEDVLEVEVPGHPTLVEVVNDTLIEHFERMPSGARPAGPGEFSARAFLAGRLSPGQASGIADLIAADRDEDLEAADQLRRGQEGLALSEQGNRLAEAVARVEAGIDFTDEEDVVSCSSAELRAMIGSIRPGLESIARWSSLAGPALRDRPLVVLSGPPNAGKSTLFNAMVGSERAVISQVAGTTRDLVHADLDIETTEGRLRIRLVDTAGLGESQDPLQDLASARARAALEEADVVLWCLPASDSDGPSLPHPRGPEPDTHRRVDIQTKTDLNSSITSSKAPTGVVRVSLPPGRPAAGLNDVHEHLCRKLADLGAGGDRLASHGWQQLQADSIAGATASLDAVEVLLEGVPDESGAPSPELIAAELRTALDAIRRLEGEIDPEEVLDLVFGRFCIGK